MVISHNLSLTHLFFVGDILIFCDDTIRDADNLEENMKLFKKETSMVVNAQKSTLTTSLLD